jgi:histidinol dehydrogenase
MGPLVGKVRMRKVLENGAVTVSNIMKGSSVKFVARVLMTRVSAAIAQTQTMLRITPVNAQKVGRERIAVMILTNVQRTLLYVKMERHV